MKKALTFFGIIIIGYLLAGFVFVARERYSYREFYRTNPPSFSEMIFVGLIWPLRISPECLCIPAGTKIKSSDIPMP